MGRIPEGNRKYQIEQMWSVHHEIVRLALMGMKSVDIARQLNISPVTVSYTLNSAVVRRQLDVMRGARDVDAVNIAAEIKKLLPKAVKVLDEVMDGQNDALRLRAAQDALDRGGHAAVRMMKVDSTHHFTADEIADIKSRAKDIGLLVDDVMEAEVLNAGNRQAG